MLFSLFAGIFCLLVFTASRGKQPVSFADTVLFLSRPIPQGYGSFYWQTVESIPGLGDVMPGDMPGVGPRSRFRICEGGMLIRRDPNGDLDTLIDGNNPQPPFHIVDVKSFDVSYDGAKVVFSGVPQGNYPSIVYDTLNPSIGFAQSPGAWRIYSMGVDGSNLTQLTTDSQDTLDLSQFDGPYGSNTIFEKYDDIDPAWLPDGRIVFASTRWPAFAQYTGVRTTNLYVMNSDGSGLHRITSERNGAERPTIDPLTGKIVFARWWRNFRYPHHAMTTTPNSYPVPPGLDDGYDTHEGLTQLRSLIAGEQEGVLPADNLFRNSWQAHQVNPDGTGLSMYSGFRRSENWNHYYGGCFTDDGHLIGNFFPMVNMTEAAGFGGIRKYARGPGKPQELLGATRIETDINTHFVVTSGPNVSYGIYKSDYAGEPCPLADGKILVSYTPDTVTRILQDYGIYLFNPVDSTLELIYDNPGTTELMAKAVRQRPIPPVLTDGVTQTASLLPPAEAGPYDGDGTFEFDALNVYFNAPVDTDIISASKIGEAKSIRFFTDFQRHNPGSFGNLDWPILLDELPIDDYGAVKNSSLPANVQLFEQLRTSQSDGYRVPFTGGSFPDGAGHVAGFNYERPGITSRCVGCHAGHTLIPIPATWEETIFTNLAPGADIAVSSVYDSAFIGTVADRKVMKTENPYAVWTSAENQTSGQWVKLTFRVPVWIRKVRLYDPRQEENVMTVRLHRSTVRIYSDASATQEIGMQVIDEDLTTGGVEVLFDDLEARAVKVELDSVSGQLWHMDVAAIGEIEVIASGGDPAVLSGIASGNSSADVRVFPNPATHRTQVQFSTSENGTCWLLDQEGKAVRRFNPAGRKLVSLDLSGLPAGIYILTSFGDINVRPTKVVKYR